MDQNFKVGDVVVLNSGGPSMTIENIKPSNDQTSNMMLCSWFSSGVLKRDSFVETALKFYKRPSIM